MRIKTVNFLLFLGVVSVIMAVAMFTQKAAAQQPVGCTIDPATGAQVCPPPSGDQPPDTTEPRKPRPTKTPTRAPVRIPSRTPTPAETATLIPVCGLPGLPNCGNTAVLSLVCSANLIVSASSSSGTNVSYVDPIVNSTCKGSAPKVVCVPPSGSLFPLGSNIVICTVTDSCGLGAACTFYVNVNPNRELLTATPTPVAVAPGSPGEAGAAGQNFIPPVLLLPAVKNGIIGVLIIAIIIIGGLGLRQFFGRRDLPSSPSDQFVKLDTPGGGSNQFVKIEGSNQFNKVIKGDGSSQFLKFEIPGGGGGLESATMTIHDIHFDPQDKINSFDANGFNSNGFDANGFDQNGFNSNGFNANGFDQNGFNSNGFNANGFDQNGFNSNGFNANGFDQNGFNSNGFDANGFDANGLDSNGFKGEEWIGHQ